MTSGLLGKYVSWHNYRGKANATLKDLKTRKPMGAALAIVICHVSEMYSNRKWIF
jgi:hypothetical protein